MVRWLFSTNAKDIGTCAVRVELCALSIKRYILLNIRGCIIIIQCLSRSIGLLGANNPSRVIADGPRKYGVRRPGFDILFREPWQDYAKKLEFERTTYGLLSIMLLLLSRISRVVSGKLKSPIGSTDGWSSPEATSHPSEESVTDTHAQESKPGNTSSSGPNPKDENGINSEPSDQSASNGPKSITRRQSSRSSPRPKGSDTKAKGNREQDLIDSPGSRKTISNENLRTLVQTQLDTYKDPKDLYNGIIHILGDPHFLQSCYILIKSKPGNMSRGLTNQTLDGINFKWFEKTALELKSGAFQFKPARRVLIPKPGKAEKRPLGVGNPREKIIQKALTVILEAIFEPEFLDCSHGFRPFRSTHSALKQLYFRAHHYTWVIQGDISKCFDRIPHDVVMRCLRERIKCDKFLTIVRKSLKAGYLDPETNRITKPDIGTPQGSVLSPLLSNIVLHQFDKFMMKELIPSYHKGGRRRTNPAYNKFWSARYKSTNEVGKAEALRQMTLTPRMDPQDPNFRRMLYVRYADDFVILTEGPKSDTSHIKTKVKEFLDATCGLELNEEKTIITHGTEGFNFLGANINKLKLVGYRMKTKTSKGNPITMRANIRARINAPIPELIKKLIKAGIAKRDSHNKVVASPLTALVNLDHATILQFYNARINGIESYYTFASNRTRCKDIIWLLRHSCAKTLARKYKLKSSRQVFKKFGTFLKDPETYMKLKYQKSLAVIHKFNHGMSLLPPLKEITKSWFGRLTETNIFKECLICGTTNKVQMHHIRAVKDVRMKIRTGTSTFEEREGGFLRKQIPLCSYHHNLYHKGELFGYEMSAIKGYSENNPKGLITFGPKDPKNTSKQPKVVSTNKQQNTPSERTTPHKGKKVTISINPYMY